MKKMILRLRKGADRRLRNGHPWVYSNEVDTDRTPLRDCVPGDEVIVEDARGATLGTATVNPNSLICARLFATRADLSLNEALLVGRMSRALAWRETCYREPYYRLVYGESDWLPGLVVDRFGDYCAVQLTTAGMDRRKEEVLAALVEVLQPRGVILRNKGNFRRQEGLPEQVEVAFGRIPDSVQLMENGVAFATSLFEGQKTGWFYDHRENRARLQTLVSGKSVLDVFSYIGGWGIQAAVAGAEQVTCLDSSAGALQQVTINSALNGVSDRVDILCTRAADGLKQLAAEKRRFDVVVLDPPAFIKRRRDQQQGEKAYRQINQLALKALAPGGLLVSASCSMHLAEAALVEVVHNAGCRQGRSLQIVARGAQGPDHPVHPAIPETAYLKALFVRDLIDR